MNNKTNILNKQTAAKIFLALFAVVAICALSACSQPNAEDKAKASTENEDKISVVASFYPMADFTKKIGGERVEVKTLVPNGTEPHDWEPTATDIMDIEKSQVLVYSGAGMEHWVDDTIESLSNKDLVVCDASRGIVLLNREQGEHTKAVHKKEAEEAKDKDVPKETSDETQSDPHVWLNPKNVKIELGNIRDALVKADPEGAQIYQENYETYIKKCDKLDEEFESALKSHEGEEIVVSHQAFGYLCDEYGLKQIPIEGINADSEPSAAQMKKIIDYVKEHNIKVIFTEELLSPKLAETISHESGASIEVLSPIEGLTEEQQNNEDDYFTIMEDNLKKLEKALS